MTVTIWIPLHWAGSVNTHQSVFPYLQGLKILLALSGLQFWVGQLVNDHVIQFLFAGCGSGPPG